MRQGVRVKLKYLMPATGGGGRTYWYVRMRGQKLVKMPNLPHDHPEFLTAYAAAVARSPARAQRLPIGSIGGLIEAAMRSDRFKSRSEVYRATLKRNFEAIKAKGGEAPAKGLRAHQIRNNVYESNNPTDRLKAWRFMCAFAVDTGLLSVDPSAEVKPPEKGKIIGHEPWTRDEIEVFRQRWPMGTAARAAMELLLWTGARIGDAVLLGRGAVGRDGVLAFRQRKTGGFAYVPWTCDLPDYAAGMGADRDQMHEALAAIDSGHMTFLATRDGRTKSSKSLGTLIREGASEVAAKKSAHGLRKARAVMLAEAGATTHQIGAWTGHESLKEIEHYTLRASRRSAVIGTGAEHESANTPRAKCKQVKKT